jgi:hypothetical protein
MKTHSKEVAFQPQRRVAWKTTQLWGKIRENGNGFVCMLKAVSSVG